MITTAFLLMASRLFFLIRFRKELEEFGCFTMGIVKEAPLKWLDKFMVFYSYSYKGKVFTDFCIQLNPQIRKGGKYLVYLDAKLPKFNRIDFSHQVTAVEIHQIISAPYPHKLN